MRGMRGYIKNIKREKNKMEERVLIALMNDTLSHIESMFDSVEQNDDIDIVCSRQDLLLDVAFLHNNTKLIINGQLALAEIWVAAKAGGFHYRYDGKVWRNTRDNSELMASLSILAQDQAGVKMAPVAPPQ